MKAVVKFSDSYNVKGIGVVSTGKVIDGELRKGLKTQINGTVIEIINFQVWGITHTIEDSI